MTYTHSLHRLRREPDGPPGGPHGRTTARRNGGLFVRTDLGPSTQEGRRKEVRRDVSKEAAREVDRHCEVFT